MQGVSAVFDKGHHSVNDGHEARQGMLAPMRSEHGPPWMDILKTIPGSSSSTTRIGLDAIICKDNCARQDSKLMLLRLHNCLG